MNKQKGFTIIELIVVIAIIAVLAGMVLINVNGYIKKAKIATIKADMSNLIKVAAKYYISNANGSYSGFCNNSSFTSVDTAITKAGTTYTFCADALTSGGSCYGNIGQWAYYVTLPDSTYWCVDYLGNSKSWDWSLPWAAGYCDCYHMIDAT